MARAVGESFTLLRLGSAAMSRLFRPQGASSAQANTLCCRVFGTTPEGAEDLPESSNQRGWGQTKIRELLNWKRDQVGEQPRVNILNQHMFGTRTERAENGNSNHWGRPNLLLHPIKPFFFAFLLKSSGILLVQGQWLFCSKDDLVFDAVKKMANANVGSLVVFDPSKITVEGDKKLTSAPGEAVVGIITERDYLTKMIVEGRSSKETAVSEIMTPESKLMTVNLDHSVAEAMQVMADKNVRHLPVVDNSRMMGMVSIRDVVKVMVMEHRQEMDQMQQYIQGMY